jgi:hypothetical protein
MKFKFLRKGTRSREMLRDSATLASSTFPVHYFPAMLLRTSGLHEVFAKSGPMLVTYGAKGLPTRPTMSTSIQASD